MGNHGICDFPSSRRICRIGLTPHIFTDGDSEAKEEYCVFFLFLSNLQISTYERKSSAVVKKSEGLLY